MKGRSHRIPSSEPPDDWGDGSWTVDCICGVTFDDGEEMVNCDECGVWVHTRCSRFVKGETSFACDKCKKKKFRNSDNEETEVAQLLVELPTKTVRMDPPAPPPPPPRPPFRLWTDIPIEDRVHVQGVPGGDPALFRGLSSVFSPGLWKCTGYVPKKFDFQYREFPCWEESDNPADAGAGVLFSLSKEIVPYVPKGEVDGERKKDEGENDAKVLFDGYVQTCLTRENNQLQPVGYISGKRKKEESGGSKDRDRSAKRKARSADKEMENKRGPTPVVYSRKLDLNGAGSVKIASTNSQDVKNKEKRDNESELTGDSHVEENKDAKPKHILSVKVPAGIVSNEASGHSISPGLQVKVKNVGQSSARVRSSPRTDASIVSLSGRDDGPKISLNEDIKPDIDGLNHLDENNDMRDLNGDSSSAAVLSPISKPTIGDVRTSCLDIQDACTPQYINGTIAACSEQPDIKVKTEIEDYRGTVIPELPLSLNSVKLSPKHSEKPTGHLLENVYEHDIAVSSPDHKSVDHKRLVRDTTVDRKVLTSEEPYHRVQELEHSTRQSLVQESSLNSGQCALQVNDPSKSGTTKPGQTTFNLRKLVAGVSKSSSASPRSILSKSSAPASHMPQVVSSSPTAVKPFHSSKQRVKVNTSLDSKKEHASVDAFEDGNMKSRASSVLKSCHTSRISHFSSSKHSLLDSKDQHLCLSSKSRGTQNTLSSGFEKAISISQTQIASSGENRPTTSGSSQQSEKVIQSSSHLSSKVPNHSSSMRPPTPVNASATLSDEELALLLHQELNSSPRVPRVPRMRQAGAVTQLASTAASGLVKRSSGSGGKDHVLFSRRKNKEETLKDGSRSTLEPIDETKRMDRLPASPDHRRYDSDFKADSSTIRSSEPVASSKRTMLIASTISNCCPLSSTEINENNSSSIRSSPKDNSDDDRGTVAGHTPCTLPGLIDEIMSKGKRMSYEELCDAVLPHWHKLRKHNGERYAYSSHLQAVLDCLRNRNEWSHLIDRGPKTNSGRKRRSLDSDTPLAESESEEAKDRSPKEMEGKSVESNREDFPKGKRKARKRRRLALQGRGVKDVWRREKVEMAMEDDHGAFSHSSEGTEGFFSEDENQEGTRAIGAVGSEASASGSEGT